jgi:hypothetical protein
MMVVTVPGPTYHAMSLRRSGGTALGIHNPVLDVSC